MTAWSLYKLAGVLLVGPAMLLASTVTLKASWLWVLAPVALLAWLDAVEQKSEGGTWKMEGAGLLWYAALFGVALAFDTLGLPVEKGEGKPPVAMAGCGTGMCGPAKSCGSGGCGAGSGGSCSCSGKSSSTAATAKPAIPKIPAVFPASSATTRQQAVQMAERRAVIVAPPPGAKPLPQSISATALPPAARPAATLGPPANASASSPAPSPPDSAVK